MTTVPLTVTGCSAVTGGPAPRAGANGNPSSASASASASGNASAGASDGVSGGGGGACGSESGFCVTVNITGATMVHGTAQTLNLGTCAAYAKGGSPGGGLQLLGVAG
jgi:hypothetical protein